MIGRHFCYDDWKCTEPDDDGELVVCDGCRLRIHESEAQRWGGEILCEACRERFLSPKIRGKAPADR
jgi:hypothetical protein